MTNSAKTPNGKARKGTVSVRQDSGSIKACFPRTHFADEKQLKLATGIPNDAGWEATAGKLQRRLQLELESGKLASFDGSFNMNRYREILEEYGLRAKLRIVKPATADGQLPPLPELSILEIWDMYCEYKRNKIAETTYRIEFRYTYLSALTNAIKNVGEDAIKIHNWLLQNRNNQTTKSVLSHLSHAYKLAMKQNLISHNPFDGLSDDVQTKKKVRIINQDDETDNDADILDSSKAYTWNEAQEILDYVKHNNRLKHWHSYLKFKFLTGCRSGEAMGLWWNDVKWNDECIVIQRAYNYRCGIHKPTKNETKRFFPMPKDGELWSLLKSLPEGKPNENVFKTKTGVKISGANFYRIWAGNEVNKIKGIIPILIEQGKVSKYLPPYNTRHTFINHQINDIGIAPHIVNAWCEHSENTSREHYRDLDLRITPGYGETNNSSQKSEIDLLKEQLRQQQETIDRLSKMIEQLTNK